MKDGRYASCPRRSYPGILCLSLGSSPWAHSALPFTCHSFCLIGDWLALHPSSMQSWQLDHFFSKPFFKKNFIPEYCIYIIFTQPFPPMPPLKYMTTSLIIIFVIHTHTHTCWVQLELLIYKFRADHLGLDNLSGASSLEKLVLPFWVATHCL